MNLVDKLDERQRAIIFHDLIPAMPIEDIKNFSGSVRNYIRHLRSLGLGDNVLMVLDDVVYLVPAKYATYIYLKGGVFVNE